MIILKRISNDIFNSNTFILTSKTTPNAWLIDCGDYWRVKEWLDNNRKRLCGVFLTHCHFDHIYGLNVAHEEYPSLILYAHKDALYGIQDSKINKSLYTDTPFIVDSIASIPVRHGDEIELPNIGCVKIFETPGHSPDSCSFQIGNYLFTGDALIPNIKVVTKIKGGNKFVAQQSVDFILSHFDRGTIVQPGHMREMILEEIQRFSFNYV